MLFIVKKYGCLGAQHVQLVSNEYFFDSSHQHSRRGRMQVGLHSVDFFVETLRDLGSNVSVHGDFGGRYLLHVVRDRIVNEKRCCFHAIVLFRFLKELCFETIFVGRQCWNDHLSTARNEVFGEAKSNWDTSRRACT